MPLCTASRTYAKRKVEHLPTEGFSPDQLAARMNTILSRACVCHELSGGVTRIYDIHPSVVALVCPGPNIADFSRTMSLDEMVGHIYGRVNIMTRTDRPHIFIRELSIYAEYLRTQLNVFALGLSDNTVQYFQDFKDNLLAGISYYEQLAAKGVCDLTETIVADLASARKEIEGISLPAEAEPAAVD